MHDVVAPKPPAAASTEALRRALRGVDPSSARDLLFLEGWEMRPLPGAAAALRVGQIRRANPELAAAIRAEIDAGPTAAPFGTVD